MIIKRIQSKRNSCYKGTFSNSPFRGPTRGARGGWGVRRGVATHSLGYTSLRGIVPLEILKTRYWEMLMCNRTIRYNAHSFRTVVDKAFLV